MPVDDPGIELLDRRPGRADVRPVTAAEKARVRRRVAERAYGKGWRTYELPACARCDPDGTDRAAGLPRCTHHERLVRPAVECGPDCAGYDPADPPDVDTDAVRARRTPWDPEPDGLDRRQVGLDRFE